MKLLIFIAPKEFKDESISTVKLFLDKWDVQNKVTSYAHADCVGSHGAIYKPEVHTSTVSTDDYDGIVLIDGRGIELYKIYDHRPLLDLLLRFNERRKKIIAINDAIKILARANIIKGKKIATPEDEETKRLVILFHGIPTTHDVETADNIITVRDSSELANSMQRVIQNLGLD